MKNFGEERLRFGVWRTDAAGLPCFDLELAAGDAPEASFRHLLGTGRVSALADRWGNVNLFTTDGGFLWFNSPESPFARSSLYLMVEHDREWHSLLFSELMVKRKIRVGTGYIEYHGGLRQGALRLDLVQRYFAPPERGRALYGEFTLTNCAATPVGLRVELRSDVAPSAAWSPAVRPTEKRPWRAASGLASFPEAHPQLGEVFLRTDEPNWSGSATRFSLRLGRSLELSTDRTVTFAAAVGYGDASEAVPVSFEQIQNAWRKRLESWMPADALEDWVRRECVWSAGQLLAFTAYDRSVDEYYVALGGYGWPSFGVREVAETSLVLAAHDWELTAASLRFVAKTQLANGDVPKCHNLRRDRVSLEFESDTELWFVLGCVESIRTSGRIDLLDEVCAFWDAGEAPLWEHLRRAFFWVRERIGRGVHGLILIRDGDWNDYLSLMGAEGRGESVMNSGIACRAFAGLAGLARERSEAAFAAELESYVGELRTAVAAAFDGQWFFRGYTDAGKPIGSQTDDRLWLDAQSWAVLGGCGAEEQRRAALRSAVERCHTRIGLTLASRPYSSPPPDDLSWCAIPAGEGENAGIWPQTVHWLVWALAEEGLVEEALAEWRCGTLHAHARTFPDVPFGIFNGPDCYSSHWAGGREGWTQVQLIDRARFVPMNPVVAWQGFSLHRIIEAARQREPSTERRAESAPAPSRGHR